ncbi:MAG: single-stranded-DNA-specific exonuclease RecJ [Phycisphaerales bacterium]|nr:single-stranded-DNA-specific exonuclease RecJ [Phycisphaerales bacterium]
MVLQRSAAIFGPRRIERDWHITAPQARRREFSRKAGVSELVAQVLLNRGIADESAARGFLAPAFSALLPPETLPGALEAARRLVSAVRAQRRIVIYGDYDVDGVTATSILWHALRLAGADVHCYVPSRFEEGYGLNADALERLAARGAQVVITVDCGVTAVREAQRARELGLELIITDHHQRAEALPDALIVHPTATDAPPSPNADISGAGVAMKVAWAFARELSGSERVQPEFRDFLLEATAFAALGLVADVVPIVGENRILATHGLRHLCHTRNPGLRALIGASGLEGKARYDDYDVGFLLAPRLNAVGRMGHAREAVELFTTADESRAADIAGTLEQHNRKRQSVERAIVREAEDMVVHRGFHRDGCRAIVLASREWHVGVIGIAAARMVNRFHRPAVLIALDNGSGQGSGRSIRHFPLHEALGACRQHLQSFGGHAMAAGVRLSADAVDGFTEAFQQQAAQRLTATDLRPRLTLDDEVELAQLTPESIAPLARLAPHGIGNARPKLATTPVELVDAPRVVGTNGAHVQLTVRQGAVYRKAIAFRCGEFADEFAERRHFRLAFEPIVSEWNGRTRVELKVVDWKWVDPAAPRSGIRAEAPAEVAAEPAPTLGL